MEGMVDLLLADNGLDDDLVLSYSPAQLHHHEAAQALLANLPLRVLRCGPRLVGSGMSYSTSMPSTFSGSKPKRRRILARRMSK
jgi:hypothetical protein